MDTIKSKAIVLGSIKYNDNYKIMYVYTYDFGRISVLWKYNKTKRNNFPLPLTEIEIVLYPCKNNMYKLKDFCFINHNHNIYTDNTKTSIVIFLSEVIMKTITFSEKDSKLYDFLSQSIDELNNIGNGKENFHIYFLIRLTKQIGINPILDNNDSKKIFSLKDGCFVQYSDVGLTEFESVFLKNLFRMNTRNLHLFKLNRKHRNTILDYIIMYYKIHVVGFNDIKSLEILRIDYNYY